MWMYEPILLSGNENSQPNRNKRRQTLSNATLIIRFFQLFWGGRTAHNGLVGASSRPLPSETPLETWLAGDSQSPRSLPNQKILIVLQWHLYREANWQT